MPEGKHIQYHTKLLDDTSEEQRSISNCLMHFKNKKNKPKKEKKNQKPTHNKNKTKNQQQFFKKNQSNYFYPSQVRAACPPGQERSPQYIYSVTSQENEKVRQWTNLYILQLVMPYLHSGNQMPLKSYSLWWKHPPAKASQWRHNSVLPRTRILRWLS